MIKKIAFYSIMVLVMLALLEIGAFTAAQLIDSRDYFDHREPVLARLTDANLENFRRARAHPVTGWNTQGPKIRASSDCQGRDLQYTINPQGARIYPGFDPDAVKVIVVGDSYSFGSESDDSSTYPAKFFQMTGLSVANHGVPGFGPVQAFLNLKTKADLYPNAELAVLAIMNENLYRMMNRYRPVLYEKAFEFGIKPYMQGGKLIPYPGKHILKDTDTFRDLANEAFDTDFWAKPEKRFPYFLALTRSLASNHFRLKVSGTGIRRMGRPEFELLFGSEEIQRNLVSLINEFAGWSADSGLRPVVMFIPRNRYDLVSASGFIDRNHDRFHHDLTVGNVGSKEDIDWRQFNLERKKGKPACHPSSLGYEAIAAYLEELIKRNPGIMSTER